MLSKQGFDLWAEGYDQTVQVSEETGVYPFAGYRAILNTIFNKVMGKENVLDIGFGTGVLTSKLYDHEHQIDGIDFSPQMIALAHPKMPDATLVEWDITNGLPEDIQAKKYDYIVSTYALHHLTDNEKGRFIQMLLPMLEEEGKILIGDIAFGTRHQLESCRQDSIEFWDEDEFYFVFDELQSMLKDECNLEFHALSHCGGVIIITRTY